MIIKKTVLPQPAPDDPNISRPSLLRRLFFEMTESQCVPGDLDNFKFGEIEYFTHEIVVYTIRAKIKTSVESTSYGTTATKTSYTTSLASDGTLHTSSHTTGGTTVAFSHTRTETKIETVICTFLLNEDSKKLKPIILDEQLLKLRNNDSTHTENISDAEFATITGEIKKYIKFLNKSSNNVTKKIIDIDDPSLCAYTIKLPRCRITTSYKHKNITTVAETRFNALLYSTLDDIKKLPYGKFIYMADESCGYAPVVTISGAFAILLGLAVTVPVGVIMYIIGLIGKIAVKASKRNKKKTLPKALADNNLAPLSFEER